MMVILMERIGGILDLGQLSVECHLSTSPAVCSKNNKERTSVYKITERISR